MHCFYLKHAGQYINLIVNDIYFHQNKLVNCKKIIY